MTRLHMFSIVRVNAFDDLYAGRQRAGPHLVSYAVSYYRDAHKLLDT